MTPPARKPPARAPRKPEGIPVKLSLIAFSPNSKKATLLKARPVVAILPATNQLPNLAFQQLNKQYKQKDWNHKAKSSITDLIENSCNFMVISQMTKRRLRNPP